MAGLRALPQYRSAPAFVESRDEDEIVKASGRVDSVHNGTCAHTGKCGRRSDGIGSCDCRLSVIDDYLGSIDDSLGSSNGSIIWWYSRYGCVEISVEIDLCCGKSRLCSGKISLCSGYSFLCGYKGSLGICKSSLGIG
jgi:hypothetical protein